MHPHLMHNMLGRPALDVAGGMAARGGVAAAAAAAGDVGDGKQQHRLPLRTQKMTRKRGGGSIRQRRSS